MFHPQLLIDDAVAPYQAQLKADQLIAFPSQHHLHAFSKAIDDVAEVSRVDLVKIAVSALLWARVASDSASIALVCQHDLGTINGRVATVRIGGELVANQIG